MNKRISKFIKYDTHLSPSYLSLRSQLSHNPATPLREINAEWLKTYLVNIKIKFEHINFPNNSKQGPKIDGFRKSPSKSHLIWKLKLAPPRPRITLRAGRNKLYEAINNQNRWNSYLRHGLKYWTVSLVPWNIAYTMRISLFIIIFVFFTELTIFGWFQLL